MVESSPLASLSLDLDNKWSYLKVHGDAGWESFPSYLDVVVPRVLDFLAARRLRITFFIVGQDAALEKNREALGRIAAAGHEIGNHSFEHEPWMHRWSGADVDRSLALAEEHIERTTGRRTIGFRGPGYALSPTTLEVLKRRGYRYDASTLPTFLGPLARTYYLLTTNLPPDERARRKELFGTLREGLRPNRPYRWQLGSCGNPGNPGDSQLVELPVTTMPVVRTPVHASYVLYLSLASRALALSYFKSALSLCRLWRTQPSILLHPLDFLGPDDAPELAFFPAMRMPLSRKLATMGALVDALAAGFNVVPLEDHARAVAEEASSAVLEVAEAGAR